MNRHNEIKNAYKSLGGDAAFSNANITCLDYFSDMMERAKRRTAYRSG